jgi:adenylate cyclase
MAYRRRDEKPAGVAAGATVAVMRAPARRTIGLLLRIGADPADTVEVRSRKALLVAVALMVLPASVIWGAIYWAAGEPAAAFLPWAYTAGSVLSLAAFHLTRDYRVLRWAQLLLILWIPVLLGIALGGLAVSGVVIIWSLLAPLGAVMFDSPRNAWPWFIAFAVLLVATTPLAAWVRLEPAALPDQVVLVFLVLNVGVVSLIAFVLVATFAHQRADAQERADRLLLNILPPEIAELLKSQPSQIAEQFEDVSVLFADVVDFTPLSAGMTAAEVVGLLDRLFTDFDVLVDKYGVEKIKTIGDAYMVAAGVPRRRPDHARVLAELALEMRAAVARYQRDDGKPLALRIGINSGPVVAGVIGRRKFVYDLWGDAVNTASRMESHGTPGEIQLGEATYELVKDDFVCKPRGLVDIKGKGRMATWYLMAART